MWRALNYIVNFLIVVSAVRGCVPISAFVSLVGLWNKKTKKKQKKNLVADSLELILTKNKLIFEAIKD